MDKHCCEFMNCHANFKCNIHEDLFECLDKFILSDKREK
ncbi:MULTISPECIES: DUF6980 family protein [Priestia]